MIEVQHKGPDRKQPYPLSSIPEGVFDLNTTLTLKPSTIFSRPGNYYLSLRLVSWTPVSLLIVPL